MPDDVDPALFEALRAWRGETSRALAVPAYVVANDRTLHAIAAVRPQTPAALQALPGVGPAFMERHAGAVLAIVGGGEAPPVTGGTLRLVATVEDGSAGGAGAEDDPDLVERLRAWRLDAARMRAVPAYVVAHDRTLAAIAEARPRSEADLLRVRGVGHTFVERHGEDVLALVGT